MNIGVFCASSDKLDQVYMEEAARLGQEIARYSWTLVYGGTNCGLMGKLALATLEHGGGVKGVIPRCIAEKGVSANYVSDLVVAEDMKERKELLRRFSDAFVALPGGWGTLEEITEVITLKQLGVHNKPIVFVNTAGFYNAFFRFIEESGDKGFISAVYTQLYTVVDCAADAIDYIRNYKALPVTQKYRGLCEN